MIYFYFLAIINVIASLFYIVDKVLAILKRRRVPEKTLLGLSILGGAISTLPVMYLIHHKTRKRIFIWINSLFFIIYIIISLYMLKFL